MLFNNKELIEKLIILIRTNDYSIKNRVNPLINNPFLNYSFFYGF
jgi:hypothetical protein